MILTLDTETSIYEKGNPFVPTNKLVSIAYNYGDTSDCVSIEHSRNIPYGTSLHTVQQLVSECNVLVGFHIKFDLHWLRRYGISFDKCHIFDCQLAAFILAAQRTPYPSLDDVAFRYLDRRKLDTINTEYWQHGIDTPDIPWEVIYERCVDDVNLTKDLYYVFQEILNRPENKKLKTLVSLCNQDLLTLEEMEWNGLKFDFEKAKQKEQEIDVQLKDIYEELNQYFPDTSINWNSNDHLSCILYGGTIVNPIKIPNGVYKTGDRVGQDKYSWSEKTTTFPRLVEPLHGSQLLKEGYWSTGEDILKQLKAKNQAKQIISLVLRAATLEKLNGTYYRGIPKLAQTMGWGDGFIHGNFNQTTAVTGRLSSSRPNLQNFAAEIDELIITRF